MTGLSISELSRPDLPLDERPKELWWALVPVKPLVRSKQRLKPQLGTLRGALTSAMLRDVLTGLNDSRAIDGIAVITTDPAVAEITRSYDARVIDEVQVRGMNGAIAKGVKALTASGAARVAIVAADIPLVSGAELDRILLDLHNRRRQGESPCVGIVPSRDRDGTNLLCLESVRPFTFSYGPNSSRHHINTALTQGGQAIRLRSNDIALDLDNKSDLQAFIQRGATEPKVRATHTWEFLKANNFIDPHLPAERVHAN